MRDVISTSKPHPKIFNTCALSEMQFVITSCLLPKVILIHKLEMNYYTVVNYKYSRISTLCSRYLDEHIFPRSEKPSL